MDNIKNKTIKITKNIINYNKGFHTSAVINNKFIEGYIKPISKTELNNSKTNFATMDIETVNLNDIQHPIAISLVYGNEKEESKLFLIKSNLINKLDLAVELL
jgi:hypothetical protein